MKLKDFIPLLMDEYALFKHSDIVVREKAQDDYETGTVYPEYAINDEVDVVADGEKYKLVLHLTEIKK